MSQSRFHRAVRQWRKSEAGQSLVEFSLVLPMLLILLFAIVDFGRAFYAYNVVTNAAREGARTAAVQGTVSEVNAAVAAAASGLSPTVPAPVTSNVNGPRGSTVTVTVNYSFSYVTPLSPLLTLVGGSSLSTPTISSTAKMRLE